MAAAQIGSLMPFRIICSARASMTATASLEMQAERLMLGVQKKKIGEKALSSRI